MVAEELAGKAGEGKFVSRCVVDGDRVDFVRDDSLSSGSKIVNFVEELDEVGASGAAGRFVGGLRIDDDAGRCGFVTWRERGEEVAGLEVEAAGEEVHPVAFGFVAGLKTAG